MNYYLEACHGSVNKHGEELCGDKVEMVKTKKDITLVLADGLGSGVKANILASLTSKIVVTMLTTGAEVEDVIETMASTLPVCSVRQIAYSTFTFLQVDRFGEAHFVEYDNPPLVVLRDGRAIQLEREKVQISDKTLYETRIRLVPGDLCVVFSDGAVHAGVGKLLNLGWQHEHIVDYLEKAYKPGISAFSMQSLLLSACNDLYMGEPGDDTTVAVLSVSEPCNAMIWTGPPVDPSRDEELVRELMGFDGLKVICGGTTSQIVSRYTGKPLEVALEYISPEVPPSARMEGIDLVTEGVITLGRTMEYIRNYADAAMQKERNREKKDGAWQLAELLMEKCTGARFVVGRAINPAHQNPNLPLNLNLKLRLVQEITDCLTELGREITVEYC